MSCLIFSPESRQWGKTAGPVLMESTASRALPFCSPDCGAKQRPHEIPIWEVVQMYRGEPAPHTQHLLPKAREQPGLGTAAGHGQGGTVEPCALAEMWLCRGPADTLPFVQGARRCWSCSLGSLLAGSACLLAAPRSSTTWATSSCSGSSRSMTRCAVRRVASC